MKTKMLKHKWAVIAGVCVVVLLALAGVIVVPKLISRPHPHTVSEGHMILRPAHWWQAEITEQQLDSLVALWGESITSAPLLEELWPDVLQELPDEAVSILSNTRAGYREDQNGNPVTLDDVPGYPMVSCFGSSIPGLEPDAGSTCFFTSYIGTQGLERSTLVNRDPDRTPDMLYRISIYTDEVQTDNLGPPSGSVHL